MTSETFEKYYNYWRTVFSFCICLFAIICVTVAFVNEKNLFWKQVPFPAQMVILVFDLLLLATLEGIQISLVVIKAFPAEAYRYTHPKSYKIGQLVFKGFNFEKFLMGRQIFVVICVFIAARLTTQKDMNYLFGGRIPNWFQDAFMSTGLLGVAIVATFAQLTPQVVASAYPVEFLEMLPGILPLCKLCLLLEGSGIVHLNYKVAEFFIWIFRIKTKAESKDLLADAVEAQVQSSTQGGNAGAGADERARLRPKITNKLQALCDVMDRIGESQDVDQESEIFQLALQRHPHLFDKFPSAVGGKLYASPQQIWSEMQSRGCKSAKPGFLCPISDPNHVPPHVAACQIIAQNLQMRKQLETLKGASAVSDLPPMDPKLEEAVAHILEDDVLVHRVAVRS